MEKMSAKMTIITSKKIKSNRNSNPHFPFSVVLVAEYIWISHLLLSFSGALPQWSNQWKISLFSNYQWGCNKRSRYFLFHRDTPLFTKYFIIPAINSLGNKIVKFFPTLVFHTFWRSWGRITFKKLQINWHTDSFYQ